MERREFIQTCGGACLALVGISLLDSCATTHYATATNVENKMQISKEEFIKVTKEKKTLRKFILLKPENSAYPIIVYRKGESEFTALLMRCTHQGSELSVNGDILTCSAHGSEFTNKGDVLTGPADKNLTSFPVTSDDKYIYIQLK